MFLGACRRRRRRGGLQLYQLRAAWGATGQLSGIWLGMWVSATGGAAQSASMLINRHLHSAFQAGLAMAEAKAPKRQLCAMSLMFMAYVQR